MTLYDFERDGILKPGETLLFFDDGTHALLPAEKLTPAPEQEEEHEQKDHWSSGGQVFFTGGYGWGTDPTGTRICLGRESIIRAAILDPNLKCTDPVINAIIREERRINIGNAGDRTAPRSTADISRRTFQKRGVRGRSTRRPEHQLPTAKRTATLPRLPSSDAE
jgi:hypothetical protein